MPNTNLGRPARPFTGATNVKTETKPAETADHNVKFLVLSFDVAVEGGGTYRTRVYLLNPGDHFQGFGGSRHALIVKKTASLITRTTGPWGLRDLESDLACPSAWGAINIGLKMAAAQGTLHHVGFNPE